MSEITEILREIRGGNQQGAEELLSLVYTELKRIAAQKMAGEAPGNTLQPTALVHEAWMKLVGDGEALFENRAHFFSAAAEAMRRILVDSARRKRAIGAAVVQRVRNWERIIWLRTWFPTNCLQLTKRSTCWPRRTRSRRYLVKLRYFVGMTMNEAATTMGLPLRNAERTWTYARAWLKRQVGGWRSGPKRT